MSAQPLNTTIKQYYTARTKRDVRLGDSVEALTKRLRPLVMVIPGEEIVSGVLTRDTTVADFSPYMGEARYGASRGFPIVVGIKPTIDLETAQEALAEIDFAFKVGADWHLRNVEAGLDRDMYGELAALT